MSNTRGCCFKVRGGKFDGDVGQIFFLHSVVGALSVVPG